MGRRLPGATEDRRLTFLIVCAAIRFGLLLRMSPPRRLLVVNSSSRLNRSVTRQLASHAVERWKASCAGVYVEHLDVGLHPVPAVDERWIAAADTPASDRSHQMQAVLAISDTLIDQLARADAIVIGVPHYNFGIPATLKGYFEQIVRVGRTFGFRPGDTAKPYTGLLTTRPVLVATSSGAPGTEPGGPNHSLNFVEPQLLATLSLIGLDSVAFARVTHQQGKREEVADSVRRAEETIDAWVDSIRLS
jgi:FMN-dependent NADH-azoreductase